MRAKQLITIAVASMLMIGGVAALGAASPTDTANENTPEDADDTADERDERADDNDASEERSDTDASAEKARGPGQDLPEQVPNHVTKIHDTINQYLDGEINNLGHALNDLLGDETAEDASHEDPEDTGASDAVDGTSDEIDEDDEDDEDESDT